MAGGYLLKMILIVVVLLGAFIWLPVAMFNKTIHPALRVVVGIIGLLSIFAGADRDLYHPFLGETVIPLPLLNVTQRASTTKISPEDVIVTLSGLPVKTKVVYWAAENGDPRTRDLQVPTWKEAYGSYSNSGVVESDITGRAQIVLKCPQKYTVKILGITKTVRQHLHYRYAMPGKNAMLSKVYTYDFECDKTLA